MSVLTLILAGGEGSRLSILSEKRAKPAVPFAGKYRIIDFPLSNAVNSDLYSIAVLTQYRPHSLMHHIGIGEPWDLNRRWPNGVQIWQPYRGRSDQDWYSGTADALYQNRNFIADTGCDEVLVLSGDHIYKQDYREILRFHRQTNAELTVGVVSVKPEEVHRFGILSVDGSNRIVKFTEKPRQSDSTLASMGIYVFNRESLLERLEEDAQNASSAHDFGKNIVPMMVERDRVMVFHFGGYWVDVGTIQAYWETNLALLKENPVLDLYDPKWIIHTRSEERPPAKFGNRGEISSSLVSNGCIVYGNVINSVLSPGVRVERGAVVRDSVIMTDTTIREGATIDRCIVDKEVEIGAGAMIGVGDDRTPNETEPGNLNSGITIVGKRATVPPGTTVGRNCRVDPNVGQEGFRRMEVPSGSTVAQAARLDRAA